MLFFRITYQRVKFRLLSSINFKYCAHKLYGIHTKLFECFTLNLKFYLGAEIGVLETLPFDQINVNMFLIEMSHFVGEKEKQIREIFARNGYKEGPEIFPNLKERNDPVNPNYDLIFYKVIILSNIIYGPKSFTTKILLFASCQLSNFFVYLP